jgi:plastocyanin
MRTMRTGLAVALLAILVVACGDDDAGTTTTTTATTTTATTTTAPSGETTTIPEPPDDGAMVIDMRGFAFSPVDVTVSVGTTVRWVNLDATEHTTTASGGEWNATLSANETFEYVADTPGQYDYVCTIHMGMAGTLTVEG